MYKSCWPLFKVLHPAFRFVNAIQKVRRATPYVVQVPLERRDKTLSPRQKRMFSFKMNIFCVSKPTFNSVLRTRHSRHGDDVTGDFAKTGDTSLLHCRFQS